MKKIFRISVVLLISLFSFISCFSQGMEQQAFSLLQSYNQSITNHIVIPFENGSIVYGLLEDGTPKLKVIIITNFDGMANDPIDNVGVIIKKCSPANDPIDNVGVVIKKDAPANDPIDNVGVIIKKEIMANDPIDNVGGVKLIKM